MSTSPQGRWLRRIVRTLAVLVLAGAVFVGGILVGGHPRATGLSNLPDPVRSWVLGATTDPTAVEVMQVLEDGYYRSVDPAKLGRASVDGVVKALDDPYTYYLTPGDYSLLQQHLDATLTGVGIAVARRPKGVTIVDVYPDGPARKGGLRRGDIIISVDGTKVVPGPTLDKVVHGIRGEAGTQVRIGVRRGGVPDRVYTLTRAKVKIPMVRSRVITQGTQTVGYVRLAEFDRGVGGDVRNAVKALDKKGVKSFVFDLRGDPGGLVDEAVDVVSAFVKDGSPVVTTEGLHRSRETLKTTKKPVTTKPVVVLVDRASASASEIVSGALRDNAKAPLVGTRTFGKALVQTTRVLRNGGALKYTTARYLTPSGFDLATRGLTPDVKAVDDPKTPADEALDRAVTVALAKAP